MCESVLVMYAGRVVEDAPADDLFFEPKHPYTEGLLGSIPRSASRIASSPSPETFPRWTTYQGAAASTPGAGTPSPAAATAPSPDWSR